MGKNFVKMIHSKQFKFLAKFLSNQLTYYYLLYYTLVNAIAYFHEFFRQSK